MTKIQYKLVPRLSYVLIRETINEGGKLIERVAQYDDLVTANRAARACVEYERRNPLDREAAVELYSEYRQE